MPNPTQINLDFIIQVAKALEAEGYFVRARAGDQRAASLFARLAAFRANPSADTGSWGWLTKAPGETQVDGYAEDAVVFSNDSSARINVADLVSGAGAPNASVPNPPIHAKERRENNRWEAPRALTAEELAYLKGGGQPQPGPIPPFPPRDETLAAGQVFNEDYRRRGAPVNGTLGGRLDQPTPVPRFIDFEGEVIWCSEYIRRRQLGESDEQAISNVLADIDAAWPK